MGKPASQRNGVCHTYRSERLKALVQEHFTRSIQPATVSGGGSIAHSGNVPLAYTVAKCSAHGSAIGARSVLLLSGNSVTQPRLGVTQFWCLACCQWVVTLPVWVPQPKPAPLTATQQAAKLANPQLKQASSQRPFSGPHTTGNAMVGGKYTAH